jgi:exonuclease III
MKCSLWWLLIFCVVAAGISVTMNLTFAAINCNSLNMSHVSKKNQALKIHGITKLKTDFILLSDIRLSNKNLVSVAEDVSRVFSTNVNKSYRFYHNSTKNKRGVGILVNNDLDFTVTARWDDPDENYLLLECTVAGENYVIGSCYGPNELDPEFFNRITLCLRSSNSPKIILAGDWNCLQSTDGVQFNIDCINMQNCPNSNNSVSLQGLCDEFALLDPYRYLYPDRRDFTYVPRDRMKLTGQD